jgi:acyl carrier protein
MTREQIQSAVIKVLGDIAPEVEVASLTPGTRIRDDLDLDSMDFLNFVSGLHDALGVDVPEADYPALATLEGCVTYLVEHQVPR